ncbi:unnamed protein product [Amoebophrya sp. A25]|nr:unnamed protein product [Amoebophrya sp. A25]|eukprot:GSA25T00009070001.1
MVAKPTVVFLVAGMKDADELRNEQNTNAKIMAALIDKAAAMAEKGDYMFVTGGASNWQHVFAQGMSGKGQITYNFADENGAFISSSDKTQNDGTVQKAAFPPPASAQEKSYMKPLPVEAADSDRESLTALVADVYIVFKGGSGAPAEVTFAHERGALVVPVLCSGGTSSPKARALPELVYDSAKWDQHHLILRGHFVEEDRCAPGKAAPGAIAQGVWLQIHEFGRAPRDARKAKEDILKKFPGATIVGFLASDDDSSDRANKVEEHVGNVAAVLATHAEENNLVFVTGGTSDWHHIFGMKLVGVPEAGARVKNRLYNLADEGRNFGSGFGFQERKTDTLPGITLLVATDAESPARQLLMGLVADVYVTIAGGSEVCAEANHAANNEAMVVPVLCSGGASEPTSPDFPHNFLAGQMRPAIYEQAKKFQKEEARPPNVANLVWEQITTAPSMVSYRLRTGLKKEGGSRVVVTVLGGNFFGKEAAEAEHDEWTKRVIAQLGKHLQPLEGSVAFVTGGVSDAQKIFAQNAPAGAVYNLQGEETLLDASQWPGTPLKIPFLQKDDPRKDRLTGILGDVVITIGGGNGVGKEAAIAFDNSAKVVPLIATGGASTGSASEFVKVPVPAEAVEKPEFVDEALWKGLTTKTDDAEAYAKNAAKVISAAVDQVKSKSESAGASAA